MLRLPVSESWCLALQLSWRKRGAIRRRAALAVRHAETMRTARGTGRRPRLSSRLRLFRNTGNARIGAKGGDSSRVPATLPRIFQPALMFNPPAPPRRPALLAALRVALARAGSGWRGACRPPAVPTRTRSPARDLLGQLRTQRRVTSCCVQRFRCCCCEPEAARIQSRLLVLASLARLGNFPTSTYEC